MSKTWLFSTAAALAIVAGVPDAFANTGFAKVDSSLNALLTAVIGIGGVAGAGGIIEAVTGWRFGHGQIVSGGSKTAIMGGGILGAQPIANTVMGSGTSFTGETLLPVAHSFASLLW